MDLIYALGSRLHMLVWGPATIALLLGTGIYFSVGTGFFQLRRMWLWLRATLFAMFEKQAHDKSDPHAISQFQAVSTALAGTIGTGNIVGVATALAAGGSGAVFWMWVSALFGMMTKYAENVLGNRYRYRDASGGWKGGPMVYIERGLGCRWLAAIYCISCICASFGIGNMAQANSIAGALETAFALPPYVTGIVLAAVTGGVILGGVKRIGALSERFVPLMALGYLGGGAVILVFHAAEIPSVFASIVSEAFSLRAAAGGVGGTMMARALRFGVARGIFSNEAGLGSSVIVNCASNVKEPVRQGMWGIFEVFADTIVVCTMTALCILVTDAPASQADGAALSLNAFTSQFGQAGSIFLSIALACFAFSTLLGWSYYGERALESLVGIKPVILYKLAFVLILYLGCTTRLETIWAVSDTFNGLMAIPNLAALLLLSPEVFTATKQYLQRQSAQKNANLRVPKG